jgi:hypothetical protein
MCWSLGATAAMTGLGAAATVVLARRRAPTAFTAALAYFTAMEGLQVAGYLTLDQCTAPSNQTVAWLSIMHIVFQPFFINAFALELVGASRRAALRVPVFLVCAAASLVMLMQLTPFDWAGRCAPGALLCGPEWCVSSGDWHLAWEVPYNGLLAGVAGFIGRDVAFPTYLAAVFLLPVAYGAWRFALYHALAGPILAGTLTSDPHEQPAIWCLFSIAIALIALIPWLRRELSTPAARAF